MSDVKHKSNANVAFIDEATKAPGRRRRSTGPVTQGGKQKVADNAQKHGCTTTIPVVDGRIPPEVENRLVLPNERLEDWEAVKSAWHTQYEPQNDVHLTLVTQAAVADWLCRRTVRHYNEVQQELYRENHDILTWSPEQHAKAELFARYKTRAERSFQRAYRAIELLRREHKLDREKTQAAPPAPPPLPRQKPVGPPAAPDSLTALSTEGAVPLLPRYPTSLIQCVTVQVLDGKTFTLFQPRSENLTRMILNAPDPKPTVKRALYFLDGIPEEYEWITEYDNHDGRPHFVIERTSLQALQDLEREREEGSGHILPVDPSEARN